MKQLIPILILLSILPVVSAHEVYYGLIGRTVVEVAPNFISPVVGENYSSQVSFIDFSGSAVFPHYNVLIYNVTSKVSEIDNITSFFGKISSFSYVFEKEGNYFITIQTSDGQTDIPIYVRAPSIPAIAVVVAAGIAALAGYFIGKYDLMKPVDEGMKVLEGKKKSKNKARNS